VLIRVHLWFRPFYLFILFGRWHFGRKAVAYRADWCTVCERRIMAGEIRSLKIANLKIFLSLSPLIPVYPRLEKLFLPGTNGD